jgi:hypothetical protein
MSDPQATSRAILLMLVLGLFLPGCTRPDSPQVRDGILEWTVESHRSYADPFNDVDVDAIFRRVGSSDRWRVPAFWKAGNQWTIRFAAPKPGEYSYSLESTDRTNPDLNGRAGRVQISAYEGSNALLKHGPFKVSENKRHFEHADGTPFYWLGDTWWTGMSDRLSWEGFQRLTADRKAKGFTVVQFVAGLVPGYEELSPVDPGFSNEGGAVWDAKFERINPRYFDYADRRIRHLIDAGIAPAIVGAWGDSLPTMGVDKLKKHWRYVVARYGAYPVFWIVGGEVFDPPAAVASTLPAGFDRSHLGQWSEIARYLRTIDPYHHPVSIHEVSPDHLPLQEEALTDFKFFQPAHFGWGSIAVEVAQLTAHYARESVRKPLVIGEIGYETLGKQHYEDFQRTAFWLGMLNGAAGHSYGANGTWEAYTSDKPLHRKKWSFLTWEEGMQLPGSYQVGLGSKLLRKFPWWRFAPEPEWIYPRGTTFFEPREEAPDRFQMSLIGEWSSTEDGTRPRSEWSERNGNFRLPYAAGIAGEVRIVYLPFFGLISPAAPTIFALEEGVRYRAYYWEPSSGIEIDLGAVQRPQPGVVLKSTLTVPNGNSLVTASEINASNLVASVTTTGASEAGIVLRYVDADNYVAVLHSPAEQSLYIVEHKNGTSGAPIGKTPAPEMGSKRRLSVEARDEMIMASVTDGVRTFSTPILEIGVAKSGAAGLLHRQPGTTQTFDNFEVRSSPRLIEDERLERRIYDATGAYRGTLEGGPMPAHFGPGTPGWDAYARRKHLLLDAYRPERLPASGDWVLVLERADQTASPDQSSK